MSSVVLRDLWPKIYLKKKVSSLLSIKDDFMEVCDLFISIT